MTTGHGGPTAHPVAFMSLLATMAEIPLSDNEVAFRSCLGGFSEASGWPLCEQGSWTR